MPVLVLQEGGNFIDLTEIITECPDCGGEMELISREQFNDQTINYVYRCVECETEVTLVTITTPPKDQLPKEIVDRLNLLHNSTTTLQ